MSDSRSIAELVAALANEDHHHRWHAAQLLGERGDRQAIAPLLELLADQFYLARLAAAQALTKLGWSPDNDAHQLRHLLAAREWDAVAGLGGEAAPALVDLLDDGEESIRRSARDTLITLGPPALPALIDGLTREQLTIRERCATALGSIGDPAAVAALIAATRDEHHYLRRSATLALGSIGDQRAIPALIESLREDHHMVFQAAIWALTRFKAAAVEPLAHALVQPGPRMRIAETLARIGEPARPALATAARSADQLVRTAAENGLLLLEEVATGRFPWGD